MPHLDSNQLTTVLIALISSGSTFGLGIIAVITNNRSISQRLDKIEERLTKIETKQDKLFEDLTKVKARVGLL